MVNGKFSILGGCGKRKIFLRKERKNGGHIFDGSLVLTVEELSCAPAEVIGRSCHGTLYKATLDSGHELAIKWLREGITKGKKELAREIKKLGTIKHPNLVSVQGYYLGPKEHEKLIISNYMNAQSLDIYLHGKIMVSCMFSCSMKPRLLVVNCNTSVLFSCFKFFCRDR